MRSLVRLGATNWTEYAVLSLYQMLVDFLKPQDLIATTNSVMPPVPIIGETTFRVRLV